MKYGSMVYHVALFCGVYLRCTCYAISHVAFTLVILEVADRGSRPVCDVGLRLFACWDCGFESRPRAWVSVSCGMLCVGRYRSV